MQRAWPLLLALTALAAAAPAQAHGTFEAAELEVHVLNDEGSDAVEAYGGYDINEAFLGSAYVPDLGDAVYVRLELYGSMAPEGVPNPASSAQPWRVEVSFDTPAGPAMYEISTSDGASFDTTFHALDFEVDEAEHSLSIQRAVIPPQDGARPGEPVMGLMVRSYWGGDLRDVAPGGLPLPFVPGGVEYTDPNAIPGEGRLVDAPVPPPTDAYFGPITGLVDGNTYTLLVQNGLQSGAQHVRLLAHNIPGWTVNVTAGNTELGANATAPFAFTARPAEGQTEPQLLELLSDVGGRLQVEVAPNGTLQVRGNSHAPATPERKDSPGLALPLAAAAVAALAVARRR